MHESLFNYNIIKVLGEGGMSRVYLGEDPVTHQQVAIKELLPNLAHSKDLRERFRREAQIMAKLDHPNIVKLLKFEETATSFYLIMEYVDGMDLEQHIKEVTGPISEPKAIEIMSTLLDAFGYAHEKGVVHRDIKPANIIITRDGKVKVLDFGIAKIVDENASGRTQTGTRIGTVAYMSPEQVNAAPDIDLRTDIYSLGVMLHQMITGKAAYDTSTSSDFEVQTLIVKEPLPRANTIYPYASDHLQKLIDKATQKKRENRFQDCDQFKLAILKKDQKSSEPSTPMPPSEPDENNNSYVWIGFVVILFFIIVIVIALINQTSNYAETSPTVDSIVVAVDTVAVVDTIVIPGETSQNRTINLPTVDNQATQVIKIQSVVLSESYTSITFIVVNNSETEVDAYSGQPGESEAFYILADGYKYDLTSINLGNANNPTKLQSGYQIEFTCYFNPIPLNTSTFDLIEGTSNTWGMTGVHLN